MSLPLRHDHFTEWRESGSDLPFQVWLRSREALQEARTSQPASGGWPVAVALLVTVGAAVLAVVILIVGWPW